MESVRTIWNFLQASRLVVCEPCQFDVLRKWSIPSQSGDAKYPRNAAVTFPFLGFKVVLTIFPLGNAAAPLICDRIEDIVEYTFPSELQQCDVLALSTMYTRLLTARSISLPSVGCCVVVLLFSYRQLAAVCNSHALQCWSVCVHNLNVFPYRV